MKLLVVIVNYRTAGLTVDCLRSLAPEVAAIDGGCRVCVTDGKSPDDSVAILRDAIATNGWSDWCELRPLATNGGFAFGNNEGIRPHLAGDELPEFVLLLNPDTIVRPGAIATLLAYIEARPDVGIAGSRTIFPDGTLQTSSFRFPSASGELEWSARLAPLSKLLNDSIVAPPPPSTESDADWVVGASMMIRRKVLETIGLLDDRYFMYYEEVDFCLRARRAGFKIRYVPESVIVHLIGKSSGVTDAANRNRRRPAYWFESRRRFFTKNFGVAYAMLADLAFIVGFASWRVRRAIQRKPDPDPAHLLGDFIRHSVFLKGRA